MSEIKRVALKSLGCKTNGYETEAMTELLEKAGYEIVPFDEKADVYIVNTCTVTNMADRKSRQVLHKAKKLNPEATVVAAGCYVQAAAEDIKKDSAIDIIVGNDMKSHIVEIIESDGSTEAIIDINNNKIKRQYEELNVDKSMEERARAYIKIQDGCNMFCSYCIIPFARGRVRCREPESIIREVKRLGDKGYREVVLTGIHISSYKWDVNESAEISEMPEESDKKKISLNVSSKDFTSLNLGDVVSLIGENNDIKRIRLGSLEPRIVTREFMDKISSVEAFCPQFHLSLQSGCDATLKRMNRRYNTEEFLDCCKLIREYYPDAALTTDIIVGFPGETEEEFEETYKYLEGIGFYQMHVFKYSVRRGTRAALMDNQIPENIKAERSERLIELSKKMQGEYMDGLIDKEVEILTEEETEIDGDKYIVGHTKEYVKVAVPVEDFESECSETEKIKLKCGETVGSAASHGELINVLIKGILKDGVVLGDSV